MHENEISEKIIGAAIEVHRKQVVPIIFKGVRLGTDLRLDLLVEDKVIVEIKAKESLSDIDKSQLLTYLKLIDKRLGLLLNFHRTLLHDGIHRVVNNL